MTRDRFRGELARLAAMPESEIDTSDIPETVMLYVCEIAGDANRAVQTKPHDRCFMLLSVDVRWVSSSVYAGT